MGALLVGPGLCVVYRSYSLQRNQEHPVTRRHGAVCVLLYVAGPSQIKQAALEVLRGACQASSPRPPRPRHVPGFPLEAAPIGGQLFAHDTSRSDYAAIPPLLDTYTTRLLAQALSCSLITFNNCKLFSSTLPSQHATPQDRSRKASE